MVEAYFMENGIPVDPPISGYQNSVFSNFQSHSDFLERSSFNQLVYRKPLFYQSLWLNLDNSEALNWYEPDNLDVLLNLNTKSCWNYRVWNRRIDRPRALKKKCVKLFHERKIELALENCRYIDLRRWIKAANLNITHF